MDGICMSELLTSVVHIMIVPRGNSSSIIAFICFLSNAYLWLFHD